MNDGRGSGAGSALLVLIFSVLCLTVSSLLTLHSANGEKVLAEKLETSTLDYYAADNRAVEVAVCLREALSKGTAPAEIGETAVTAAENDIYTYSCAIDERHSIAVSLKLADGKLKILSWCKTDLDEWTPDATLTVWSGKEVP